MQGLKKYSISFAALVLNLLVQAQTGQLQPLIDDFERTSILQPGEKPEDKVHNNIFIEVSTSKKTVFTGEPILVTYQLYTALNSESSVRQQPFFTGCSVQELTDKSDMQDELHNGKRYHVFLIRKVQLTPLQERYLQLGIASVDNVISFTTANNPGKTQNYSATVSSRPLSVTVNALPGKNRPVDFSGAVGKFTISAKTDSNTVPAGENIHLEITIKGSGNLQALDLPLIHWPQNTEHFDGTDTQHLEPGGFPLNGDKTFDVPFLADKEGKAIIPPIYFSYFDPALQSYKTIHTDSLPVVFTPAIAARQAMTNIVTEDITNRRYLWIVPAIACTVLIGWLISSRKKKTTNIPATGTKEHDGEKLLQEQLSQQAITKPKTNFALELQALAAMEDDHAFFALAKALLSQAIQEKCDTALSAEATLPAVLQRQFQNASLTKAVETLYQACNLALYSPVVSNDEREKVQAQLSFIMQQMELS